MSSVSETIVREYFELHEFLVRQHRKYIAHDLLAHDALMRKIVGSKARRLAWKSLSRGAYVVETTVVVHDFLATNGFL